MHPSFWQKHQLKIETLCVFLLAAAVRLTSLNVFRAVDEEDRWEWAVDFYRALLAGDLSATLVGDGYPGIFPAWLETIWLFLGSLYRSALQGRWFGDEGVYLLLHEWSRTEYLGVQRFPVALANTVLVVIMFLYLRRLFERRVALLATIFISLDPFYLSDSRVNRAEGLLTGLMMISLLAFIAAQRWSSWRQLLLSAGFGGLAMLTKSQAVVLLPMFGVIGLLWQIKTAARLAEAIRRWLVTMLVWTAGAGLTFVALWPATWTVPGPTFTRMFEYATGKVGAEGVKIFFLGETVLDEDPGLIFYPVIFLLRSTPVMLLGLALGGWLLVRRFLQGSATGSQARRTPSRQSPFENSRIRKFTPWLDETGAWALLAYALLYVGGMSLGSHKQDRFLMAAFPPLYVLAAMGYVHLAAWRGWSQRQVWAAGAVLLAVQLATALPFHPYYFSYFNPLLGGGPTAVRLTRIGWGEGMDQVASYLQSQENAAEMMVATRFWRYLLGYQGHKMNLGESGNWVRADKIVFYIQQSQRMLEPSPGIIRYFETHILPEKVVTIDRIEYAKIYPNPIQYPADPLVDRIDDEMSLFGYRWQEDPTGQVTVRLIWENLSRQPHPIGVRLWGNQALHSPWQICQTRPGFETAIQTPGEIVESDCPLPVPALPAGLYDLQVGVRQNGSAWQALNFAAGWSAIEHRPNDRLTRVSAEEAFAQLALAGVPANATPLEHLYADRVRLLAYEITPETQIRPGQPVTVTLYWQAQRVLERDAHVSLQAFAGDNERVALVNGPPAKPTDDWRPGEVIQDRRTIVLPPDLPVPAIVRLDAGLFLPDTLQTLPVTNLEGQSIPAAITQLRVEPDIWPAYHGDSPLSFTFDNRVALIGYELNPVGEQQLFDVALYWKTLAALPADKADTVFLHVVDANGELVAQSDAPPARGFYPTSAWQPGDVVISWHQLALPTDLPPGVYRLVTGLYRASDGARLPGVDANGAPLPDAAAPIDELRIKNDE